MLKKSPAEFASAWLHRHKKSPERGAWLSTEWIVEAQIIWSRQEPKMLFDAIMAISADLDTEQYADMLGSGPMEDLLNNYYCNYVSIFFEIAEENELIRCALEYIYPPFGKEEDFEKRLKGL